MPQLDPSLLPEVEGINWGYGLIHLKDAELLKDTVMDFYRTIDSEAAYLEQQYEAINESEEALNKYRIKVHAMKSSAALIGAAALSGVARLLEYAARDGILEVIHSVTPVFLADWRSYKDKLQVCMPQEEKQDIEDMSLIVGLLERLQFAMEEMDIDVSDEVMEELRQYEFAEEVQALVDELGTAVAVDAYVEGRTFAQIDFVKRNILKLYEEDLAKYDKENREKASVIFKTLPEQLENKNSHFKFSLVDKNARYKNYVDAVSFISESMIGNECINVTKPEVVLELFADRSNFKLYMGDTGLLVTQVMKNSDKTDENLYKLLIIDELGINQGMILENAVAQMLRASGHELYFHEYQYKAEKNEQEKKYEIDFLVVKKKKICPIEVKSSGYRSHKSFDYLTKKYQLKVEDRYIIYTKDLRYEDGITYIPVYMTAFI